MYDAVEHVPIPLYTPPVLRVRVAPPMVLIDDARSPDDILAATRRDGFPCWDALVDAWSPRRPPAAASAFASLSIAEPTRLLVAHSRSRAADEHERATLAKLAADDVIRAVVIIVREPEFASDPARCHVDADSWELLLAEGFDRVCVRQWIWSCPVPDDAWLAEMMAAQAAPSRLSGEDSMGVPAGDTLWLAGAVFGGVRSRRSLGA